jgi:zinc protease
MLGLSPGMFTFYLGTDPLKVDEVRRAFTDEIAHLASEGLGEQELSRAKKKMLGKQAISSQSNASLAYTAALDELYDLGYLYHLKLTEQIESITLEQVREVARRYFHEQPSVTAIVRPQTLPVPAGIVD